jgi:bifunctional DNA-binding transcriptional regulator/antitoxin component of YhaV-PrlF toxin-antitoxin module
MVLGYTFHTMKAVLSSKGELVIPGSLLKRYGLHAGATVVLEAREGEIALRPDSELPKARLVRQGDDVLLEASADAPAMTPENVKQLLEDWP